MPRLRRPGAQAYTLNALAQGHLYSGRPGRAVPLYRLSNDATLEQDPRGIAIGLANLSEALRISGALRESEAAARHALPTSREFGDTTLESVSLQSLGLTLAARGHTSEGVEALRRSLNLGKLTTAYRPWDLAAMVALWRGDHRGAQKSAQKAITSCETHHFRRGVIRSERLQGAALLGLGDLATAERQLHHALTEAREVDLVEEELQALAALAELRREQGDPEAARELLNDVWESAERGPYPLFHADALNVLAQIERDSAKTDPCRRDAAVEAATKAYGLAWCDGPPFAFHWALKAARAHLKALGAPEPTDLPPYDDSKYEPMPEVEIDPPDEFGSLKRSSSKHDH